MVSSKAYLVSWWAFIALASTEASHLRGQDTQPAATTSSGRDLQPSQSYCYCEQCTSSALEQMADGHTCGNRMSWLQDTMGFSEVDACRVVAAVEFPDECGACNPNTCQVQQICGDIPTCTADVLQTMACDDTKEGCFQCGERIKYLLAMGVSNTEACHRIAVEEFPSECGLCAAEASVAQTEPPTSSPTMAPTPTPTSPSSEASRTSPTAAPTVTSEETGAGESSTASDLCFSQSCTQEVWDTEACDSVMGGCYTCGERIEYLLSELGYSETAACQAVSYYQFPSVCSGCRPEYATETVEPVNEANLVWSDEFDYEGSPDPTKWTFDLGTGEWGWGNNELQYYTDRLDNVFVEDGVLHIRAVREDYEGSAYTSARIKTKNLGDWTYGRIQLRIRLLHGTARGTWPAAWMLSTDNRYNTWPASGEIDIMEHVGYDKGRVHGTVHTQSYNHMLGTQDGSSILMDTTEWQVHEIVWTPEKIDFVLDGFIFHTFERDYEATFSEWPFDERFHLILNMAVGGGWGGLEGVDEASFVDDGQIMEVDWVRVYSS